MTQKDQGLWVRLYHSALLELDIKKLADRISEAENAIQERERLLRSQADGFVELRAMDDAVRNLQVLRKELPGHHSPGTVNHMHPELVGDYVAVVNASRHYVAVTDGVCRLLGYTRDEMLAKTIDDVTAPEMVPEVPSRFSEYVRSGFMQGEYLLVSRGGGRVAIRYEARAFPDGCLVARWEPLPRP